jgi:G3E family GTPase
MKKYLVTVVPMTTTSRRRSGKARVLVIESDGSETPKQVERRVQMAMNHPQNDSMVKVIDVREATEEGK